jgi:hypothetical protein
VIGGIRIKSHDKQRSESPLNRQELQKKVRHIVQQLVFEKGYASPLDLFLKMEKVSPKLVEDWRFRRVPYLERVLHGNLSQFNFILTKLRETSRDLELKESCSTYVSWGKGPKRPLRFSKSGDIHSERRYSTHYVKPNTLEQNKAAIVAEASAKVSIF